MRLVVRFPHIGAQHINRGDVRLRLMKEREAQVSQYLLFYSEAQRRKELVAAPARIGLETVLQHPNALRGRRRYFSTHFLRRPDACISSMLTRRRSNRCRESLAQASVPSPIRVTTIKARWDLTIAVRNGNAALAQSSGCRTEGN